MTFDRFCLPLAIIKNRQLPRYQGSQAKIKETAKDFSALKKVPKELFWFRNLLQIRGEMGLALLFRPIFWNYAPDYHLDCTPRSNYYNQQLNQSLCFMSTGLLFYIRYGSTTSRLDYCNALLYGLPSIWLIDFSFYRTRQFALSPWLEGGNISHQY